MPLFCANLLLIGTLYVATSDDELSVVPPLNARAPVDAAAAAYVNVDFANPKGILLFSFYYAYALAQLPNTSDPVLNTVITSIAFAPVESVGAPPWNLIAVESSSVNVAV